MLFGNKLYFLSLFIGDIAVFVLSLWLTLFVRLGAVPVGEDFYIHLLSFLPIFLIWVVIFYISDLYQKSTIIFRKKLPSLILRVQIINSIIAVVFFYFFSYFQLTPKTILFIDLIISFILVLFWRRNIAHHVLGRKKQAIYFACSGPLVSGVKEELLSHPLYDIEVIDGGGINAGVKNNYLVVIDKKEELFKDKLSEFYNLIFKNGKFVTIQDLYESIFDREPIDLLDEQWFIENISAQEKISYDILKRITDIIIATPLLVISIIFYPFVFLAIKLDDNKELFSIQSRIGQKGRAISVFKFRTRSIANDDGDWDGVVNEVTGVGKFLRKTRIDELPQLWNVLMGDLSLVGPRPEMPDAVLRYGETIPFYNVRHIVKPGLSGWAQIYHDRHPHHSIDIEETKNKLSYDIYYIKNRGFWLDLKIALKTAGILVSQKGR